MARRERALRVIVKTRVREWLLFDAPLIGLFGSWLGLATAWGLAKLARPYQAVLLLTAIHRSRRSLVMKRLIERAIPTLRRSETWLPNVSPALYDEHLRRVSMTPTFRRLADDPLRILGKRILVLKSPREHERGAILVDYIYAFPLFARLFEIERIAESYWLILEPSWVGACNLDLLCYTRYSFPVFVETTEPEERGFIQRLASNLVPVEVGGNWWVDHRMVRPLPGVVKDADVVMVAAWSSYKRHDRFFAGLKALKRRGRTLKVLLLGYAAADSDLTLEDIRNLADFHGVTSMLEIHDGVAPEDVNAHLNRAKVCVLWSRREGYNRAIIEAMLADVPVILRRGHNYGHPYPYINPSTGCFADEKDLPVKLWDMVTHHERYKPRAWVLENMSSQRAAAVLSGVLKATALAGGENWTEDLAVKTVQVNTMKYWHPADSERFRSDYERILSWRRR